MYIHPRHIKERLFAQYTSAHANEMSDEEDEGFIIADEHETTFTTFTDRDTLIEQHFIVPIIKPYKSLERLPSTIDHSDEFQMIPTMIRSTRSCSNLTAETIIRFDTNYAFTLDETKHQKDARKIIRSEPSTPLIDESQIIPPESVEIKDVKENLGKIKENLFFEKFNRSFSRTSC